MGKGAKVEDKLLLLPLLVKVRPLSHSFLLSRALEGLFELTRRPSWALYSPWVLLPELQRYKDTVRCARLGARAPSTTTDAILNCAFVENALFYTDL